MAWLVVRLIVVVLLAGLSAQASATSVTEVARPSESEERVPVEQPAHQREDPARGPSVSVLVDRPTYRPGEPILVSISNDLSQPIHLPADPSACALLTLERRQDGPWETVGSCPPSVAPGMGVTVPENGRLVGTLGSEPTSYVIELAVASEPVSPDVSDGSLSQLPPAEPWKLGDPVREVRQGIMDSQDEALPLSTITEQLEPGTYRVAVTFSRDRPPERVETSHSREFVVTRG